MKYKYHSQRSSGSHCVTVLWLPFFSALSNYLQWSKCSIICTIYTVATGHMQLLSIQNMADATEEINFVFYFTLINLNLTSHMRQIATVLLINLFFYTRPFPWTCQQSFCYHHSSNTHTPLNPYSHSATICLTKPSIPLKKSSMLPFHSLFNSSQYSLLS